MNNETTTDIDSYDGLPMPKRVYAVIAVSLGVTLAVMDTTIVNVALPSIAEVLQLTEADSIWIINAYQLAIIMSLLSMSAMGEIHSYKKTFLSGMTVFTLASLACGLSTNFYSLVISRLIQGVGAAAMMAVNMTLLRLSYPKHMLGKGIGWNATIVALALVAGPSIASLILAFGSWHWLFWINIPVGFIGIIFGLKMLPNNIVKLSERSFPRRDAILNALFFGSMVLAVEGYSHNWEKWMVILLIVLMITVGYIYINRQRHQTYPLLPVDLMRIPIFSVSVVTSICSFTAQMLALVSLPFYLQHTLGYTASEAGLLYISWPFVILFVAPIAGSLIGKIHAGILGGIGLSIMATGLFFLALLPDNASQANIVWRLMLCGAGFGLFQSPNNNVLMTSSPQKRSGSASGMLAMARLLGQTAGATILALLYHLTNGAAPRASLYVASVIALCACLLSISRMVIPKNMPTSTK